MENQSNSQNIHLPTAEQLIKAIEQWRGKQNLTKKEMARKLKISWQQYWNWLKGYSKPYPRKRYLILQILGKPITIQEYQYWKNAIKGANYQYERRKRIKSRG